MTSYRLVRPKHIYLITGNTTDDVLGGQTFPVLAFTNKRKALRYLKAVNITAKMEQTIPGRTRYYTIDTLTVL